MKELFRCPLCKGVEIKTEIRGEYVSAFELGRPRGAKGADNTYTVWVCVCGHTFATPLEPLERELRREKAKMKAKVFIDAFRKFDLTEDNLKVDEDGDVIDTRFGEKICRIPWRMPENKADALCFILDELDMVVE